MEISYLSFKIPVQTLTQRLAFFNSENSNASFSVSSSKFRPFPFRLQNENTGEALSLWHLTSPAPFVPVSVEQTIYGPEVHFSSPATNTDSRQRSFVLRRHAHTGPLLPLCFVAPAIANIVCLFVPFNSYIKTSEKELISY